MSLAEQTLYAIEPRNVMFAQSSMSLQPPVSDSNTSGASSFLA